MMPVRPHAGVRMFGRRVIGSRRVDISISQNL
jgi:hypothetical protein